MTISFDFMGTFTEHRAFFREMAKSLQKDGHKVGVIANERQSYWPTINKELGFTPDFVELMQMDEEIPNVYLWKINKMVDHDVLLHYDDDAAKIKVFTDRWIVKVMNNAEKNKF